MKNLSFVEKQPLISLIIAVKDPSNEIMNRCISSFAALVNSKEIQVVVVVSGKCSYAYQGESFHSVSFNYVEPEGVYAAYSAGIDIALGKYVIFFGEDDIALPEMDNVLIRLNDESSDVWFCSAMSQKLGLLKPHRFRPLILLKNVCHQSIIYRKSIFKKYDYERSFPIQADHFLNIMLYSDLEISFTTYSNPISYFSSGGISSYTTDLEFRRRLSGIAMDRFGVFWGLVIFAKQLLADIYRRFLF
jgi:glycosyltransferase involved in cell wall biosynthesis